MSGVVVHRFLWVGSPCSRAGSRRASTVNFLKEQEREGVWGSNPDRPSLSRRFMVDRFAIGGRRELRRPQPRVNLKEQEPRPRLATGAPSL